MSEWQSIETAPKDGTAILVIRDDEHESHEVVYYEEDINGFVWCGETQAWHQDRFTHWMPLPPPPESG